MAKRVGVMRIRARRPVLLRAYKVYLRFVVLRESGVSLFMPSFDVDVDVESGLSFLGSGALALWCCVLRILRKNFCSLDFPGCCVICAGCFFMRRVCRSTSVLRKVTKCALIQSWRVLMSGAESTWRRSSRRYVASA